MERDFLGLKSTKQTVMVKEEIVDGARDSGFTRGSGMLWPFMNKVHTIPRHYMSFKVSQEDRSKTVFGTNAFNPGHNRLIGEAKNLNHDEKNGSHFPMALYAVQPEQPPTTLHRPHGVKLLPNPNISLSMNNPIFKTQFTGLSRQNLASVSAKQQTIGGVASATSTQPTHSSDGSVVGFTGQYWHNAKTSSSPPQLTIFYGGKVNIYDDISPEKAQTIMLLARNGSSMASEADHRRSQFQPPCSKMASNDCVIVNKITLKASTCFGVSSPMSDSLHTGAQSRSGSTNNVEMLLASTSIVSVPKIINSVESTSGATMRQSDIPQARKASLARFLEKRKERVMTTAAPYEIGKKSQECA